MSERKPAGISRSYWFSLPRGSRLRVLHENYERAMFAIEWRISVAEDAMCESIAKGLHGEEAN